MQKVAMMCGVGMGFLAVACMDGSGGLDCTEMGCSGSLEVLLSQEGLSDGEYILSLDMDGELETCSFILPFDAAAVSCSAGSEMGLEAGDITVRIMTPMGGNFEVLAVDLAEQDSSVFSTTVNVDWSEPFYPNGEECDIGFGCYSGSVDLVVE